MSDKTPQKPIAVAESEDDSNSYDLARYQQLDELLSNVFADLAQYQQLDELFANVSTDLSWYQLLDEFFSDDGRLSPSQTFNDVQLIEVPLLEEGAVGGSSDGVPNAELDELLSSLPAELRPMGLPIYPSFEQLIDPRVQAQIGTLGGPVPPILVSPQMPRGSVSTTSSNLRRPCCSGYVAINQDSGASSSSTSTSVSSVYLSERDSCEREMDEVQCIDHMLDMGNMQEELRRREAGIISDSSSSSEDPDPSIASSED